MVEADQGSRRGTTLEQFAKLKPALKRGSVTAGNLSSLNDGAAAVLVISAEYVRAHSLEPMARNHARTRNRKPPEVDLADPYPYFAKFHSEAPIFYAPKIDFSIVSRYEDIQNIGKDPETFSNVRAQEPLYPLTKEAQESLKKGVRATPTTSIADSPLHRHTRKHAARAFSAKRVVCTRAGRIRETRSVGV